jgi:hypothetical protein
MTPVATSASMRARSQNLMADLTVNTDFAQVEADQQQVNLALQPVLSREARLLPRKRRHFLVRKQPVRPNANQSDVPICSTAVASAYPYP